MKDHGVELTEEDHSNRRPGVFWIAIAGAFLIGLGVFAYFASVVVNFPGEVSASTWVQSWRSSWLDAVTKATYLPGTLQAAIPLVLLTSAAFFVKGMRAEGALILTTSVLGQLITFVLKELVARPRPSSDLVQVLQQTNSFSFPSGHATFYIVFLGTLVFILSMNMRAGSARKLVQSASLLLILAAGFSRIYLGMHWLGDVVAGYAFGAAVVVWGAWTWRRWIVRRS